MALSRDRVRELAIRPDSSAHADERVGVAGALLPRGEGVLVSSDSFDCI